MEDKFQLVSEFQPNGDQPTAIAQLCDGLESGLAHQTLLGLRGQVKPLPWPTSLIILTVLQSLWRITKH